MPRMGRVGKKRTRSSAAKRIRRTKGGKGQFAVEKASHNHLLLQKSDNAKANASKMIILNKGEAKKAQVMCN